MKELNSNIEGLIVAFLTNSITVAQQLELDSWIALSDENQIEFEAYKITWEKSKAVKLFFEVDAKKDWQQVKSRLNIPELSKHSGRKIFISSFNKVAAIFIPAIVIVAASIMYYYVPGFGRLTAYSSGNSIEEVTLPDQSKVMLNKGSKIIFTKSMNKSNIRKVKLNGEAFFEVSHNKQKPFIISVANANVKVLGTKFNVNEVGDNIYVTVVSGKVSFKVDKQEVILTKGERGILKNGKLTEEKYTTLSNVYWEKGVIEFNQANIKEICDKLKEAYTEIKEVRINTQDRKTKLTTTFKNQSLQEVIEELRMHFDKKIEFDGNILTISD